MTLRTRLIPVTALVVALGASAASVTAAAASSSKTPTATATPVPSPQPVVKCDSTSTADKAKDDEKARADKEKARADKEKDGQTAQQKDEPDWAAVGAQLGTSAQGLQDALMNTKIWAGQQTAPIQTPEAFLEHVAGLLHQPVAKVKTVLYDAGVFRDSTDKPAKN